jgi:hypothetical protein
VLAADALEVIEQFPFNLTLRAGTNTMDRLDQQIDQVVGQAARTQMDECGQPGEPRRIDVPPQFIRCLDRYPSPAALQIAWRRVIEQIGWKGHASDQVQLANSSCMLARLGRPAFPRSVKRAAGALPVTPSPSAEPSSSSRRPRIAGDNCA